MIKFFSIFKKNTRVLLGSFLAYLFLISIFIGQTYFSYTEIIRLNLADSESKAILVEQALTSMFLRIDLVLLDIVEELERHKFTHHLDSKAYQDILRRRFDIVPEMAQLKIIDENGNYLGDAEGVLPNANIADQEYFKLQKSKADTGMVISEPVISKGLDKWTIIFSRRLRFQNGEFAGLVIAGLTHDFLDRQYAKLDSNPGEFLSLIRPSNNILLYRHPRAVPFLNKTKNLSEALKESFAIHLLSGNLEVFSPITRSNQLISFRSLDNYDLTLIKGSEKDQVLRAWKIQSIILTGILLIFGAGGAVLLFHYLLTKEEAEAQRAQNLQSSKLSALGEMAGGVAHEINTPLAVFKLLIGQIKTELSEAPDLARIGTIADKLDKTSDRIASIVRGMRNIARDSSKDPKEDVPVKQIIEDVLILTAARLREHSVELRVDSISEEITINCRSAEIGQVILNFISNANDAIETLPTRWIELKVQAESDLVKITITDSGAGIPKGVAEKIFNPFFTTKEVGRGTGLGLSVSLSIIRAHGGSISINEKSPNTQFVITLPTN